MIRVLGLAFGLSTCLVEAVPARAQQEALPRGSGPPLLQGGTTEQVIALLERQIPYLLDTATVPGLGIALVHGGTLTWHRGFGVANAETGEPITDGSVFEAASLSKPVFAYAVLKLVDHGLLDLDRPLSEYLPDYEGLDRDHRLHQITARRVLSHTTGFPNWRPAGGALAIHFPPGERFSYSGEGFVYLAKVVERITTESINQTVSRLVFGPLGMTQSSFVWREQYTTDKADLHSRAGKPTGRRPFMEPSAASSLHTTAEDYGRFVAAILNGTGLVRTTMVEMLTPQIRVDQGGPTTVHRPATQLSPLLSWGLGWGLQQTEHGMALWHWGDNGDSKAFVVAYPESGDGVVVLTNSANGLLIVPEILEAALGGEQPALAWLKIRGASQGPGS